MKDAGGEQNKDSPLERSRSLRRNATDAEKVLWRLLRDRQLEGAKFRRQYPFGPFILHFYCYEQRLAIEVDGGQHKEDSQAERDEARTHYLQERGVQVLRFTNIEVLRESQSVAEVIRLALRRPSP